jgi:amidophosphoribosyltransferase
VAKKFGPLSHNFQGKIIVLIDDSIVRGTTIGQLIRLLKDAGAKEVHIRIASPPLHHPCYMGINIPTREELIANHMNDKQLAQSLGKLIFFFVSVLSLTLIFLVHFFAIDSNQAPIH